MTSFAFLERTRHRKRYASRFIMFSIKNKVLWNLCKILKKFAKDNNTIWKTAKYLFGEEDVFKGEKSGKKEG